MGPGGARPELRVGLRADEERVRLGGQLGDLDERAVRRGAGEDEAGGLELRPVGVVDLVPVPVPLGGGLLAVRSGGTGTGTRSKIGRAHV